MSLTRGLTLQSNCRKAFESWAESPSVERRSALLQTIVELEHQLSIGEAQLPRILREPTKPTEVHRFTKGYES